MLKGAGFTQVTGIDTLKTALSYLQSGVVHWVITSPQVNEPITVFHLLELALKNPLTIQAKFTIIADSNERLLLPGAFSLGALSWLPRELKKDVTKAEVQKIFSLWNTDGSTHTTIAASYLDAVLRELRLADSLAALYEKISECFPQQKKWLLKLASAQFEAGKPDAGERTLGLAQALDVPGWADLAKTYLAEGHVLHGRVPMHRVVVVEPDEMIHKQVREALEKKTSADIVFFTDGLEAIKALKTMTEVDAIFMEWKIPKLSGPAFLQRLRANTHEHTPVVVTSSLLTKQDLGLVSEMSVGQVLPKPFTEKEFINALINVADELKNPTTPHTVEAAILRSLQRGESGRAASLVHKMVYESSASEGQKQYILALLFFHQKKYKDARDRAKIAFPKGGDPLKSIHLLGQCLFRLDDYAGAVKCFRKAQEFAPKNLERLCLIAEAESHLGHTDASSAALEEAKALDSQSEGVVATATRIAISSGDLEQARNLMRHAGNVAALVADLNNTGVAFIRNGQFEEGMEFYEKTLAAIPEEFAEWKLKVSYNLGLAYARQNKLEAAKTLLEGCQTDARFLVSEKIKQLFERVSNALAKKITLKFSSRSTQGTAVLDAIENAPWDVKEDAMARAAAEVVMPTTTLMPGDYGCYLLYFTPSAPEFSIKEYLKNPPSFRLPGAT